MKKIKNNIPVQPLHPLTMEAREYFDAGDYINAIKTYNIIFSQDPYNIEAGERIGFMMITKGNYETAEKIFLHLVKIFPDSAEINSSMGNVCSVLKKYEEAISYIKIAANLDPRNVTYQLNLGVTYYLKGDVDGAIKAYKRALELSPDNVQAVEALNDITFIHSPFESQQYLEKLYKLKPNDTIKIGAETFIPLLYRSQEEIDEFREGLSKRIDSLLTQDLKIPDLRKKTYLNIFYLAYHARNNRELKTRMANLYQKAAPDLNYTSPHIENYKFDKSKKIKIGFASAFFYKHPVAICFSGLIMEIAKDPRFDVHIIHAGYMANFERSVGGDEYVKKLMSSVKSGNFKVFDEDIYQIREEISKLELDILIYPDVGMYWLTYFLAFARLAPIQAMMTGHPDTSGVKNIDYYMTTDDFEAEGVEDYYSEKLVRFKNIITSIEKPDMPGRFKTRAELNLPLDKNIYYCPMKNHKFHPDFDFAVKEILEKDPNAVVMFPKDSGRSSELTTKRINKNIGKKLVERIIYHPWATNVEFLSYLKESDVILDTFHFGAGTTVYYAFAVDAPIVTLPGLTSGGRVTNAVYKKMGITDLIAKDKDDYVNLAVKMANDKEFSKSVRNRINTAKEKIYNDISVVEELKEFFSSELEKFSS